MPGWMLAGTFAVFLGIALPGSWTSMREMESPCAGEVEREAVSVIVVIQSGLLTGGTAE